MTNLEAKRRKFREEYTGMFLLGAVGDMPPEQVKVMKAFFSEGYQFFINKYAEESEVPPSEWMNSETATYGLKG